MGGKIKMAKTKKVNPWIEHLMKEKKKNPKKKFKEVMKIAKKTYKPKK